MKPISDPVLPPELVSRLEALREAAHRELLGLYVHVPFCVDRCTYCSFVTTCDHTLKPLVVSRLEEKLRAWGAALEGPSVDTVYLGGGTPSVLSLEELCLLTSAMKAACDFSTIREATLEANPGTVDASWLEQARRWGWDRISLGIQTLDDDLLNRLGRIHSAEEGLAALALARAVGFQRISADLMIGIPGQNLDRVLTDARRITEAGASHLSVYMLDLDKACAMKRLVDAGDLTLPADEEVAESFEALQEELPKLGFHAYEISNYAMEDQESVHNNRYWERRPYLGIGPSAASHLDPWRWSECSDIDLWSKENRLDEFQELNTEARLAEIPLLGLRMLQGINWEDFRHRAAAAGLSNRFEAWEKELGKFIQQGLLLREGSILRFSSRGLLLSNQVLSVFV